MSDLPGSHIGEPDPSYEVVESVLVRKSRTNTGPPIDGTATQHQYSEIKGTICQGVCHIPSLIGPPNLIIHLVQKQWGWDYRQGLH